MSSSVSKEYGNYLDAMTRTRALPIEGNSEIHYGGGEGKITFGESMRFRVVDVAEKSLIFHVQL